MHSCPNSSCSDTKQVNYCIFGKLKRNILKHLSHIICLDQLFKITLCNIYGCRLSIGQVSNCVLMEFEFIDISLPMLTVFDHQTVCTNIQTNYCIFPKLQCKYGQH